jgi:hypothetical protein
MKYWGQCTIYFHLFSRHFCARHLGALCITCFGKGPHNLSILETSLVWMWLGFCAVAGIGRNKTCNWSGSKKIKGYYFILLGSSLGEREVVVFPCVGWHEIMWMFWFLKMNCKIFHRNDRQDMYGCACNYIPLVGLEDLFQMLDLQAPLRWEIMGGRVGRIGGWEGMGHSFWHLGLNHVGSKSWPENMKLMLHSWAVRQTWAQLIGKVVTVNKVCRLCPVVATEKNILKGLWRTKGF